MYDGYFLVFADMDQTGMEELMEFCLKCYTVELFTRVYIKV